MHQLNSGKVKAMVAGRAKANFEKSNAPQAKKYGTSPLTLAERVKKIAATSSTKGK